MALIVFEALLPLGIIAGLLCVCGNAQYHIHKAAHGRPKHIGNDVWNVAMERRDKKIMEMEKTELGRHYVPDTQVRKDHCK